MASRLDLKFRRPDFIDSHFEANPPDDAGALTQSELPASTVKEVESFCVGFVPDACFFRWSLVPECFLLMASLLVSC